MTLSMLDDKGFKVLGIDMLSKGTMRAGTNGALLARALNDLTLLASFASDVETKTTSVTIEGTEISPLPWMRIPTIPPSCSEGKRPLIPKDSALVFRLNRSSCSGRIGA
jgi:hypothetical protein